ncbi:GFA family protein [Methylococcus sp. EFPC2]|uniref:GFA family protein n=1 Tax=Methylococcus sp. EFPC2 TaxID=2812648 RepID=UPI001967FDEB|nr:GFA family protein [Methylococcus sp. EFPC2]QSA95782.1 GFA family protein [Methylococcus sp. EFPC2]
MLTGGCHCGAIRYEADGVPFHETNCHCSICRRTTGAPFVAWFSVARSDFRIVQGTPQRYRSSEKGRRSFCPTCGTQLTFEHEDMPDEIDITTCSLDDPERLPPRDHTRTRSKLSWVELGDGLPEHPESRNPDR